MGLNEYLGHQTCNIFRIKNPQNNHDWPRGNGPVGPGRSPMNITRQIVNILSIRVTYTICTKPECFGHFFGGGFPDPKPHFWGLKNRWDDEICARFFCYIQGVKLTREKTKSVAKKKTVG